MPKPFSQLGEERQVCCYARVIGHLNYHYAKKRMAQPCAPNPNHRAACRSQIAANRNPRSSPCNWERLPSERQTSSRRSLRRCRINRATCCRANFNLISPSFIISFLALTGVFTHPSDAENQSRWTPRMKWPGSTLTDSRSRYHGKNEREGRAEPGQALRLI